MASVKFGNNLDLQGYEVRNAKSEVVNGLPTPTAAQEGRLVYNSSDKRHYVCTGSGWDLKATDSDALQGLTPPQLRDRSTHTGVQTVATISDLSTFLATKSLSVFVAPTGALSLGSQRIVSVADGTAATDAVTKQQLDAVSAVANAGAAGIALKLAARVVATSNLGLSGLAAVDGVTPVAGDRVLAAGQTTTSANGIYVAAAGAWSRANDADQTGELAPGTIVSVREGTANADTLWGIISDAAITVGTTAQTWGKLLAGSNGEIISAGNGLSKTGTVLAVVPGNGIIADGTNVRVDPAVVARKFVGVVPAGSATPTVNHGLGTTDVTSVTVQEVVTGDVVVTGVTVTGANTINLSFGAAPTSNQYRVAVSA